MFYIFINLYVGRTDHQWEFPVRGSFPLHVTGPVFDQLAVGRQDVDLQLVKGIAHRCVQRRDQPSSMRLRLRRALSFFLSGEDTGQGVEDVGLFLLQQICEQKKLQ
jgi:hypothetical protein